MNHILPKNIHVGNRLKEYRETHLIKASEMARKLKLTRQYYSKIETTADIKLQKLLIFCQLLNVPFSFFLSDKSSRNQYLMKKNSIDLNTGNWININDRKPEPGMRVLVIRDLRIWDEDSKPYVDIANVGFLTSEIHSGNPTSITGYFQINGLYFSSPEILHPDSITFWQPSLDIENCIVKNKE